MTGRMTHLPHVEAAVLRERIEELTGKLDDQRRIQGELLNERDDLRAALKESERETLDWVEMATEANARALDSDKQLARLRAELVELSSESVARSVTMAKLEAEVTRLAGGEV